MPMARQMDRSYSYWLQLPQIIVWCIPKELTSKVREDGGGSGPGSCNSALKQANMIQSESTWLIQNDSLVAEQSQLAGDFNSKPVHNFCTLPDLGHDRSSRARVIPNFLFVTGQNKAMLLCKMLILRFSEGELLSLGGLGLYCPLKLFGSPAIWHSYEERQCLKVYCK